MGTIQGRIEAWLPFTDVELLGVAASGWFVAVLAALAAYAALWLTKTIVLGRLRKVAAKTATPWDDIAIGALDRTRHLFYVGVAIWVGSRVVELDDPAARLLSVLAIAASILQVTAWANHAVSLWLDRTRAERAETDPASVTTLTGLSYVIRLVIWSAGLLLLLDNLGVNVTALMAGLGVGGIAVALAVQNVLGDLFASLSIALDKPFVIGDFIIVGEFMGIVEHIGLKTTRIRSLSGEQLIFSNSDLLASRIRNYKRMEERRVAFAVGVTYQTPAAELEAIPGMVRGIIETTDATRFDRAHFKGFGDSAYLFEFVYYVLSAEYPVYMDVQQTINLEIVRRFADRGIEIAYPTRTLHMATRIDPPDDALAGVREGSEG